MKTRNGIYHNLLESDYKLSPYPNLTLTFSSMRYLNMFLSKFPSYVIYITDTLDNRFKNSIDATLMCAINLYSKIEQRGFLVQYKGKGYTCKDQLNYQIVIRD